MQHTFFAVSLICLHTSQDRFSLRLQFFFNFFSLLLNFYSQFGLTQTYALRFVFFTFFSGKSFFSYFLCPNVPKICLKLAYTVSNLFVWVCVFFFRHYNLRKFCVSEMIMFFFSVAFFAMLRSSV